MTGTNRISRLVVVALAVAVGITLVAAAPACSSDVEERTCAEIPDGGCPLSSGIACEDPGCHAVYACTSGGVWTFDYACPANDAMIAEPVPPVVSDASFDAPLGDQSCVDLEEPDCSASLAASCAGQAGCCGCENLFVCMAGTWVPYGSCDDDGGIHVGK